MALSIAHRFHERFPSAKDIEGDSRDVSFTRSLDSFIPRFPILTTNKTINKKADRPPTKEDEKLHLETDVTDSDQSKAESKAATQTGSDVTDGDQSEAALKVETETTPAIRWGDEKRAKEEVKIRRTESEEENVTDIKRNYSSETQISDNQLTVTSLSGKPLVARKADDRRNRTWWKSFYGNKEERHTEEEKRNQKAEIAGLRERFRPPDGGFGWLIVFGTFLIQLWITGLIKSFGIVFLEVMTVFPNSSASLAAWIPAILTFISLVLSPVTSALCIRFSCRSVVFVGGLCSCAGLALSYFATSLEHLCLTIGVLVGIGAGLSTTPGIIMTSRYFEKRRALANGICISGTAIGSMLMPPLVEFLTPLYGFRGTLLILGACMLHICIAAVLFRPVEVYQKILENDAKKKKAVMQDVLPVKEEAEEVPKDQQQIVVTSGRFSISLRQDDNLLENKLGFGLPDATFDLDDSEDDEEEERSAVHDTITPLVNSRLLRNMRNESTPALRASLPGNSPVVGQPLTRHASLQRENRYFLQKPGSLKSIASLASFAPSVNTSETPRRMGRNTSWLQSTSSLMHSVGDLNVDSTCTFKDQVAQQSGSDEVKKKKGLRYYLDFSLLKNTLFILLTSTVMLMAVGCPHFLLYLPAYVTTSIGLTKSQSGLLLSITAACDLVGRLLGGWLADMNFIPRSKMYCCSMALAAAAAISLPFATEILGLSVISGVFGFAAGSWFLMVPVLLTDYHGIAKIPSSYGLARLFQGFMTLGIPPLIGLIRDITGEYKVGFFVMGVSMGTAAISMLFLEQFAKRREEQKQSIDSAATDIRE